MSACPPTRRRPRTTGTCTAFSRPAATSGSRSTGRPSDSATARRWRGRSSADRSTRPYRRPGGPSGGLLDDAAVAAGWPADVGFAWEPAALRNGGRLVLTRRPSVRAVNGFVSTDRLRGRRWSPRAAWWWRTDPGVRKLRRRVAGQSVGPALAPLQARHDLYLQHQLRDRLAPTRTLPGGGVVTTVIRDSRRPGPLIGLRLRGTPDQLAAAAATVRRMERENLAIDLTTGGVLGLLAGLAFLAARGLWRRGVRGRRRRLDGLCPACGYDLRGGHIACPECGRPVPATA